MTTAIELHTQFVVDAVSPLIFGGFLEHMGRCIYEGVYDPDSALRSGLSRLYAFRDILAGV